MDRRKFLLGTGINALLAAEAAAQFNGCGRGVCPSTFGLGVTGSLPSLYLGQVATRTVVPYSFTAPLKQFNSKSGHYAMDDLTSLRIGIPNWRVNAGSGNEEHGGGTGAYTATVEYPMGVFTRFKFGGATTGNGTDGTTLWTDDLPIVIPRLALFWIRIYGTMTAGIYYMGHLNSFVGDLFEFAASGLADKTDGTTFTSGGGSGFRPCAIVANTRRASVFYAADSRGDGSGDNGDAGGDGGEVARSLWSKLAYIQAAIPSDRAMFAQGSYTRRQQLADLCSHVIYGLGIGDMLVGQTAAQLATNDATMFAKFGTKPIYVLTMPPCTNATNSAVASAPYSNAERVLANNARRGAYSTARGCFEVADVVESARDSGFWKADYGDGVHEDATANNLILNSGVIDTSLFQR